MQHSQHRHFFPQTRGTSHITGRASRRSAHRASHRPWPGRASRRSSRPKISSGKPQALTKPGRPQIKPSGKPQAQKGQGPVYWKNRLPWRCHRYGLSPSPPQHVKLSLGQCPVSDDSSSFSSFWNWTWSNLTCRFAGRIGLVLHHVSSCNGAPGHCNLQHAHLHHVLLHNVGVGNARVLFL